MDTGKLNLSINQNNISIFSVISIGLSAMSGYMGLPFLIGFLTELNHLNGTQSGWLASADVSGLALASITAPWWLKKLADKQTIYICLLIVIVANVITPLISNFNLLILDRLIVGMAGGIIFTKSTVLLATSDNPERSIGFFTSASAFTMSFFLVFMPIIAKEFNQSTSLSFLAVLPTLCLLLVKYWPKITINHQESESESDNVSFTMPLFTILFCFALFAASVNIMWSFVERIGGEFNFSATDIGTTISLSNLFSMCGGLIAAKLGRRFGILIPILFGISIQIICLLILYLLNISISLWLFGCIFAVYFLFWSFIDVYQYSAMQKFEPSGKGVSMTPAFIAIGSAVGPLCASFAINGGSFLNSTPIAIFLSMLLLTAYILLFNKNKIISRFNV
ncbi:MFS transporter [Colwelliaceae bacterium BS250]